MHEPTAGREIALDRIAQENRDRCSGMNLLFQTRRHRFLRNHSTESNKTINPKNQGRSQ